MSRSSPSDLFGVRVCCANGEWGTVLTLARFSTHEEADSHGSTIVKLYPRTFTEYRVERAPNDEASHGEH